jgi:hypothetical protein
VLEYWTLMDRMDLVDRRQGVFSGSDTPVRRFAVSPSRRFVDSAFRPFAVSLFLCLIAGCTTRKAAAPPAPAYPAVPATSVRVLDRLPGPSYDAIGTISVQVNADIDRDRIIADIQKRAGNAGANTIVITSEKVFTHRVETTRQRIRLRRIVAQELRSANNR